MMKQVLWLFGGLVCFCAIHSVAGTLTWTGAESGEWNTTALNWKDESANPVAWTQGSDAVFNESATATTVTLKEDIVAALAAQKLPSRSTLAVTQGTTTEPESYEGWQTILNGGDKFRGTLELDGKNLNLLCPRGLYIIFR